MRTELGSRLDIESSSLGEGVRHKLSANHHGTPNADLTLHEQRCRGGSKMPSDSAEPERSYCVVLHTMCHKRAMPKMVHFRLCVSLLEHKWADSETISLGTTELPIRRDSFLTINVWALQIRSWRPPSLCFCQASARLQHRSQK